MYHYPWFTELGLSFAISSMRQIYQQFNSTLRYSLRLRNILLGYLQFIPSHYLEVMDNYNKEKVIVTIKISPTTGITETTKNTTLNKSVILHLIKEFKNL